MKNFTRRNERVASTPSPTNPAGRSARHPDGGGLWWTFAAGLVVAAAILVAIVQNGSRVRLHYLVWDGNVSLIVVILATALAAILLDQIGGLVWRRRRRARLGRRHELEQLRSADTDATFTRRAEPVV